MSRHSLPVVGIAQLEAIYTELPAIACKGLCHDCCGPIGMTEVERQRMQVATGSNPTVDADLRCSVLDADSRCGAYDARPLICRLWGIEESMPCPFGCVPERWLTQAEGHEFLRRAAAISGNRPPYHSAPKVMKLLIRAMAAKKVQSAKSNKVTKSA